MGSSKKITRELECVLSQEEKGLLGIKACEERDMARELKEKASALDKSAKEKEHQVAQGKAVRKVECIEVKLFENSAIQVQRCDEEKYWPDGNKVVEERAMTSDERQIEIDVTNGGPKATTKAPAGRGRKAKDKQD